MTTIANPKSHLGPFKNTHKYLVTASDITGPWSEPVYLNSKEIGPALEAGRMSDENAEAFCSTRDSPARSSAYAFRI